MTKLTGGHLEVTLETASRTRTISWNDPGEVAARMVQLGGLEYMRRVRDDESLRAPVARLLDFEDPEAGEGLAVFHMTPAEFHYNPLGTVHGGVLSTLLDSAMACAIHTLLPRSGAYTTLELKVNFVRPVTGETGRIRTEGRVLHMGSRVATAEGRILDAQGKLYAHGSTTCLLLRGQFETALELAG